MNAVRADRQTFDWAQLQILALDDRHLPRVLAGLGFDRITPAMPRGGIAGFEPVYFPHRPWPLRMRDSDTVQAKGWRSGAWCTDAAAGWDATDGADRARAAGRNRVLARSLARLCLRDDPLDAIWLDVSTGEWANADGGAGGEDLVSLGVFMMGMRYGQVAWRIARACGLPGVPMMREDVAA